MGVVTDVYHTGKKKKKKTRGNYAGAACAISRICSVRLKQSLSPQVEFIIAGCEGMAVRLPNCSDTSEPRMGKR